MMPPIPWLHSVEGTILLLVFTFVFGHVAMRDVFRTRAMTAFYVCLVVFFSITHVIWQFGSTFNESHWGACLTVYGLLVSMFLSASLPVAAMFRAIGRRAIYRKKSVAEVAPAETARVLDREVSRRQVLNAITAIAPIAALGVSSRGFENGVSLAETPNIIVRSPSLPEELRGLKILQLSDLHLGISKQIGDLDRFIDTLGNRGVQPDLIVFTGDVADDFSQIIPAFEAARRLKPKLGIYSAIGNHEYFHGIDIARRLYDKAHANLLWDAGMPIHVGKSVLYLAGVNDPFSCDTDISVCTRDATERAMRDKPRNAYSILLSHRPEGFIPAVNAGVDLTLSGHTHGGQIGFNGKSAFEPLFPDGYLWGLYRKKDSVLYTTSGWGHWFPFRLDCPNEAPLIVLA